MFKFIVLARSQIVTYVVALCHVQATTHGLQYLFCVEQQQNGLSGISRMAYSKNAAGRI